MARQLLRNDIRAKFFMEITKNRYFKYFSSTILEMIFAPRTTFWHNTIFGYTIIWWLIFFFRITEDIGNCTRNAQSFSVLKRHSTLNTSSVKKKFKKRIRIRRSVKSAIDFPTLYPNIFSSSANPSKIKIIWTNPD